MALADLGVERPPRDPRALAVDPFEPPAADDEGAEAEGDPAGGATVAPRIRLLTLTSAERARWRQYFEGQERVLSGAVEQWFTDAERDPARRFDAGALASQTGMPPARVRRLLLNDHSPAARARGHGQPYDRCNPMKPLPVLRPLVLRTVAGEATQITVENSLTARRVGFHVQGGGLADVDKGPGVKYADGSHLGANDDSTIAPGCRATFEYTQAHEGVWPVNDLADVRGGERGTNAHGLFGAVVVEPAGFRWLDPETGEDLTDTDYASLLDVDVVPEELVGVEEDHVAAGEQPPFVDFYSDTARRSFREFTVFFHDEPEIHSGLHTTGEHTVMPLSYRAEPMERRLPHRMREHARRTAERLHSGADPKPGALTPAGVDRTAVEWRLGDELDEQFWTARTPDGRYLERVAGEEQHHSSWLFGEPVTHVLRAYKGDPARVRLVHAGVKETHVFHLHVHQWRAVAQDVAPPSVWGADGDGRPCPKGSQLVDSITIGPQTAMTIDPLYGSGSRQRAVGDIIWHCHLYPHFHHGMWGLWRSFDRLVDGSRAYPDGTPCAPLKPLPGRERPCAAQEGQPGFPWFVDGVVPMKSPPPPAVLPELKPGRRSLLGMQLHSPLEFAAMHPACRDGSQPGVLFVDLDGGAARWNGDTELPEPRRVTYDVEVRADRFEYNLDGWHDPRGHRYRLLSATVEEPDGAGCYHPATPVAFSALPVGNPEPFYPRANHGDVVALRLHNALPSFSADAFDSGQAPVECGLHVLIAEPHGSQWHRVDDQGQVAWSDPQAVVVPPVESGLPPYREACLGVGDFVPLLDRGGRALNPPSTLSGDDDPGSMGVNYRSAPLTFRGDDPSLWFSSRAVSRLSMHGTPGDPDTPLIQAYPGERLRVRLLQGSHEEQHSFSTHGLRWRRDWGNPQAPVVEQQSLGISEAFTLDIDPQDASPYGVGDHLWKFGTMDDLWTGCWGLVRVLAPTSRNFAAVEPLPDLVNTPAEALARMRQTRAIPARPPRDADGDYPGVRTYVVLAQRQEHLYSGATLTDPWGLVLRPVAYRKKDHETARDTGTWPVARDEAGEHHAAPGAGSIGGGGPLVLRARRGEWVRVFLVNEILADDAEIEAILPSFGPEPSPPRLPLEHLDDLCRPDDRTVSPQISLHPSLLLRDVRAHDGSYVGRNVDGTVGPGLVGLDGHGGEEHEAGRVVFRNNGHGTHQHGWREYWWYADEHLAPASHAQGPGRLCLLADMADVRNHHHHGLVGALVVVPGDVQPFAPESTAEESDGWVGPQAELRTASGDVVAREGVVLVQDGLRFFVGGQPSLPVPDFVPGDDPEDSGQMAVNFRSFPVHHGKPARGASAPPPVITATAGDRVWIHVGGVGDKPRQHSFTVHGTAWDAAPWVHDGPWVASLSGLVSGHTEDLEVRVPYPGDHAMRTGAFRWGTEHGVWATMRVR